MSSVVASCVIPNIPSAFVLLIETRASPRGWRVPDATTRPATRPDGRANSSERSPVSSIFCSGAVPDVANE